MMRITRHDEVAWAEAVSTPETQVEALALGLEEWTKKHKSRAALRAEIRVFLRSQLIATNVRVTSWPTSHGKDLDLVEVMADFIEQREKQPAALPDATGTP